MWILAFAVFLTYCSGISGQVVMEEIGALQESYAAALQAYQSVQFPQAITGLNPLIDTLTRWEQGGRLQPSDEVLLERALELRGACAFNLGKSDMARQDWTRLIQLRPEYPFMVAKTPKIVRLFEEIRTSLTGTMILSVEPADSTVLLDGRALPTASGSWPVLKGIHVIKASHPGYAPQERELTLDVGTSMAISLKLVPNARTIYFFVQPDGTQLLVDGRAVGRADRTAASQDDWAKFARENGVDPDRIYVIPALHLPPGDHRVALVCPCHRKREFALTVVLDPVSNTPGFVKPIGLERRTVNLEITSHPSGSQVIIDDHVAGTTPLRLSDFCIGPHNLVVQKAGVGLYRSSLNVTEVPVFSVEATLRPTLLWVGLTRDQEVTPRQEEAAAESIAEALYGMVHFNAVLSDEKNPVLPDTFFTPGVGVQDQAAAVKDLCERYRCQGLVAGKLFAESGKMRLSLRLFVPAFSGYDEGEVELKDLADAPSVLSLVDQPMAERAADRLLPLADLAGGKGPTFVRGSADPSGPSAGDTLISVGDKPVPSASAARAAMAAWDNPTLHFIHRGEERSWVFRPPAEVELVAFGGDRYPYRRQWLKAKQATVGAETVQEQLVARLCLCLAELNLGRPVEALKALDPVEAPSAGALDVNTVGYLKAVALVQLGREEEAREPLRAAASDATATLDGLGGALVQPLAQDLLRQLPPPPLPPPPGAAK
jgi:hypothetical protein